MVRWNSNSTTMDLVFLTRFCSTYQKGWESKISEALPIAQWQIQKSREIIEPSMPYSQKPSKNINETGTSRRSMYASPTTLPNTVPQLSVRSTWSFYESQELELIYSWIDRNQLIRTPTNTQKRSERECKKRTELLVNN